MTESKLELVDNATLLSADDFLNAIVPQQKTFTFNGLETPIRGANAFDLFRLVKRFPKARALVHNLADYIFGSDRDAQDIAAKFSMRGLTDVLIDIGDDSAAAFIAICMGQAGNEKAENSIRRIGNDALLGLLGAALTETFGGKSPQDFFTGLLIEFEKLGIRNEPKRKSPTAANRRARVTSKRAA